MRRIALCLLLCLGACQSGEDPVRDAGPRSEVDGGGNPDGGFPTGDCEQDHRIISQRIEGFIAPHRAGCQVDSDCTLISRDIPCQSSCAASVRVTASTQVRAEIEQYGQEVCPLVGCMSAGTCPSFETAICHQGSCRNGFRDGGLAF